MKSVGEVMAIGRTFQESLQKALRGLETGRTGLTGSRLGRDDDRSVLEQRLRVPGADRLCIVADAFRLGCTLDESTS